MWNKEPELRGGRYYARTGTGNETKRKALNTGELDVAVRRLTDLRQNDRKEPTLIKDIFREYREQKEDKYRNLEYFWRVLAPKFGDLRPDQISRELCRDYMASRKVKNSTILRELGCLRAALYWFNPNCTAVFEFPQAPPPKERYLTRAEVKGLLDACIEPHIRLYIILSICTAARKSALLELTWDRVDFQRGRINLGVGDGNKRRAIVPMNSTAEMELEKAFKGRLTDYVIEYRGEKVKNIRKGFALTAKRAGIENINPHVLRHSSAVWMAESRVPMSEIAQYLGHNSTKITEKVYARYSPEFLQSAATALELGDFAPNEDYANVA